MPKCRRRPGCAPQDASAQEAELNRREAALNQREAELKRLELELRNSGGGKSTKNWPKWVGKPPARWQL